MKIPLPASDVGYTVTETLFETRKKIFSWSLHVNPGKRKEEGIYQGSQAGQIRTIK